MKEGLWYVLYGGTFIGSMAASVILRLKGVTLKKDPRKVKWSDAMGTACLDIPYGEGEKNKFDLYLPADRSKESYGLVVYIHAGGFTSGDKRDDAPILQYYVSKGYVAAGVNYTLFEKDKPFSVYGMSLEIKDSIPAIAAKAAELGYPLHGMAIGGGSAGHGLAMIYAYRDAKEAPVPFRFVFGGVGPASFEPSLWGNADDESAAAFLTVMLGESITADMVRSGAYRERIKLISASDLITDDAPPSLAAYGKYDKIVPFAASQTLERALIEHRVPHDFIVCPRSGHGLQNDPKESGRYFDLIDEYLTKYLG